MPKYKQTAQEFNDDTNPPRIRDVLTAIFAKHGIPEGFPIDPIAAAKFWLAHQEPADKPRELPRLESFEGRKVWKTPYHDRVSSTLKIFIGLDRPQQVYVIEHVRKGIPWRGDSMQMYTMIVEQHELMMQDKDAYIGKAKAVVERMMKPTGNRG